jgi:hypothetical protein
LELEAACFGDSDINFVVFLDWQTFDPGPGNGETAGRCGEPRMLSG